MIKWYLLSSALALALCAEAHSQAIQLKSGTVLVGEIQDATSEGLSFRRLDNGGLLELLWEDLSPNAATKIKRLKGLVVENEEEVTVMADVVLYNSGAGLTEVVGVTVNETDDVREVKTKAAGVLPILRSSIREVRKREVPVDQVYTRGEYYEKISGEIKPGEDADKHIALSELLRRSHDYGHALEHLMKAQSFGGGKQRTALDAMIKRCEIMKESEAERKHLKRIRNMRNRSDFSQAHKLVEAFEQNYPDSKLAADLSREKSRIKRDQKAWMLDKINNQWGIMIRRTAEEKVRDKASTLAAVREYAESQMAADIYTRIGKLLDTSGEEIQGLWEARDIKKRRASIFSFGAGSWVLGEDAILKDTKQGASEAGDPAAGQGGGDNGDLERLIRKLREAQKNAKRIASKRKGASQETDESWWKDQNRGYKTDWLSAYFAEFGGAMNVTRAYSSPCHNCGGRGILRALSPSGKESKSKCPVCHGTRHVRALRAN